MSTRKRRSQSSSHKQVLIEDRPDLFKGRPWWNGPDAASLQKLAGAWALAAALGSISGSHGMDWLFLPMLAIAGIGGVAEIIRASHPKLSRSRVIAAVQVVVFLSGLIGLAVLGRGTIQARLDRSDREMQIKQDRLRTKREAVEQCERDKADAIERARRKRVGAWGDYQRCLEEAPKPTIFNPRTPEERCKEKRDAYGVAAHESRIVEQKSCPPSAGAGAPDSN